MKFFALILLLILCSKCRVTAQSRLLKGVYSAKPKCPILITPSNIEYGCPEERADSSNPSNISDYPPITDTPIIKHPTFIPPQNVVVLTPPIDRSIFPSPYKTKPSKSSKKKAKQTNKLSASTPKENINSPEKKPDSIYQNYPYKTNEIKPPENEEPLTPPPSFHYNKKYYPPKNNTSSTQNTNTPVVQHTVVTPPPRAEKVQNTRLPSYSDKLKEQTARERYNDSIHKARLASNNPYGITYINLNKTNDDNKTPLKNTPPSVPPQNYPKRYGYGIDPNSSVAPSASVPLQNNVVPQKNLLPQKSDTLSKAPRKGILSIFKKNKKKRNNIGTGNAGGAVAANPIKTPTVPILPLTSEISQPLTPPSNTTYKKPNAPPKQSSVKAKQVPCNCPPSNNLPTGTETPNDKTVQNPTSPAYPKCDYKITILQDGKFNINFLNGGNTLTVSHFGRILNKSIVSGQPQYNYRGQLESLGGLPVQYNYEGRLLSVGGTVIGYNYNGNIESIGGMPIQYNFNGTVDKIGNSKVSYDANGGVNNVSGNNPAIGIKQ